MKMEKIVKDKDGNTVYEIVSFDLKGKSYAQLPERLKEDFNNCPVEIVKHLDCSDEEVGRHIVRYNSGAKMNVAQKTITYMCNVAKDVKELSGHDFFSDCAKFSDVKDRNGTIDKIVNETIMGLNFFEQWKRNAMQLGKFLNEYATKEMFNKFKEYLDRLYNIVTPTTGKLFSEKNALIWFMLFDKFEKTGYPDEKFGEFLNDFEELKNVKVVVEHTRKPKGTEETNNLSFAEIDTCNSTKDKGMITDKLHILETLLKDFLANESMTTKETENIKEEDDEEETTLSFVQKNVNSNVIEEDIECYENMIDDCVRVDSEVYKQCKTALVALMAYACKNEKDIDFEQWIQKYQKNSSGFSTDQRINYTYMKNSFESFLKRG